MHLCRFPPRRDLTVPPSPRSRCSCMVPGATCRRAHRRPISACSDRSGLTGRRFRRLGLTLRPTSYQYPPATTTSASVYPSGPSTPAGGAFSPPDADLGTECAHRRSITSLSADRLSSPSGWRTRPSLPATSRRRACRRRPMPLRATRAARSTVRSPESLLEDGRSPAPPFDIGASAGALASADLARRRRMSKPRLTLARRRWPRSPPPIRPATTPVFISVGGRHRSPDLAGSPAAASAAADPAQPVDDLGLLSASARHAGLRAHGAGCPPPPLDQYASPRRSW